MVGPPVFLVNATASLATYLNLRSVREWIFDMAAESDPRMKEDRLPRSVWMLGTEYKLMGAASTAEHESGADAMKRDVRSRLCFTYRTNLAPIGLSQLTTDAGWGCMLRSGQMIIAQALLTHHLGRNWRLPPRTSYKDMPPEYRRVLELFADNPDAPLSVHAIARAGEEVGKRAGQWLGPNTVCSAFKRLHERGAFGADCSLQLMLYDSHDGDNTVYLAPARRKLEAGPCLLLLPVRLGLHAIDPSYVPKVSAVFSFPQSVGFIGGHPNSAHYFIAGQGDVVYFLDPHTPQPRVPLDSRSPDPLHASWHLGSHRRMVLHDLDPSVTFGFMCKDEQDLDDLARRIQAVNAANKGYPAMTVAEDVANAGGGDWDDDEEDW